MTDLAMLLYKVCVREADTGGVVRCASACGVIAYLCVCPTKVAR